VRSVIGSGCVLDPEQFFREIQELEAGGVNTKGKIFIAENTHVITDAHKSEDKQKGGKIGTTGRGNGPAYRDKYGRTGVRAKDIPALKPYLVDLYKEWYLPARGAQAGGGKKDIKILAEGAQGFGLDIDWGDYPFVTSSHCTTAGALLNGLPASAIRDVWGVGKIYETYVGSKKFEPDEKVFPEIRRIGEEFGATTGRPRQCNWMDMQTLERAIRMNGVTHVVLSKVDVLRAVGEWAVYDDKKKVSFKTEKAMKDFIVERLKPLGIAKNKVFFSESKDRI
jgi:adenylosuccinate synthase